MSFPHHCTIHWSLNLSHKFKTFGSLLSSHIMLDVVEASPRESSIKSYWFLILMSSPGFPDVNLHSEHTKQTWRCLLALGSGILEGNHSCFLWLQTHSWRPYVYAGFRTCWYTCTLILIDSWEFLPYSQYIFLYMSFGCSIFI